MIIVDTGKILGLLEENWLEIMNTLLDSDVSMINVGRELVGDHDQNLLWRFLV